jgi:hypothetical protein
VPEIDAAVRQASARIDKSERHTTVAYLLLGVLLIGLRNFFRTGWEAHLRELGIDQTRWLRAKCLAEYFKTEDECRDLVLEEALALAGWGKKQKQAKKGNAQPRAVAKRRNSDGRVNDRQYDSSDCAEEGDEANAEEAVDEPGAEDADDDTESENRVITRETEPSTEVKHLMFMDAVMAYAGDVGWPKAREVFDYLEKNGFPFEKI